MKNCVFCKIAKGEENSWVVYEDNKVKAFFDANPASEGHTLIIPKYHYKDIYEIPEDVLKRIIIVAKKLAIKYKNSLNVDDVNIMHASGVNAQQSVFHFHIHLVPRKKKDGLNLWYKVKKDIIPNFDKTLKKILKTKNDKI